MQITLDPGSPVPPFEQLRSGIATQVADGSLPPGTRMPTVRALAEQLALAVNTVARAYKELEADGVVRTEGRRGTFVASTTAADSASASAQADAAAATYVEAARRLGLVLPEATRLVERAWPRHP